MFLYGLFPRLFPSVTVPIRHIIRYQGLSVKLKGAIHADLSVPDRFHSLLPETYRHSYIFKPEVTFYFPSRKEAKEFLKKTGM